MKKVLISITLLLCLGLSSRAQVYIFYDNVLQERMGEIKATVVDSLTNEPVPFASVYVIPSKDTTITNFTLSDAKGEAKLDEVPAGRSALRQLCLPRGDDGVQALCQGALFPGKAGGHGHRPDAGGPAVPAGGDHHGRGQSHRHQEGYGGVQRLFLPGRGQCHAEGPAPADARDGDHRRREGQVQRQARSPWAGGRSSSTTRRRR